MKHLIPLAGLISRLYLAVFFFAHALQYKLGPNPEWLAKAFPAHGGMDGSGWQQEIVVVLLLIISLWLIAGIRSRFVGLIGFVLCSANVILLHQAPLEMLMPMAWTPDRLAAFAAVLMLALVGGGKWRLYPGGWKLSNVI